MTKSCDFDKCIYSPCSPRRESSFFFHPKEKFSSSQVCPASPIPYPATVEGIYLLFHKYYIVGVFFNQIDRTQILSNYIDYYVDEFVDSLKFKYNCDIYECQ
jgi:hypothetical protein